MRLPQALPDLFHNRVVLPSGNHGIRPETAQVLLFERMAGSRLHHDAGDTLPFGPELVQNICAFYFRRMLTHQQGVKTGARKEGNRLPRVPRRRVESFFLQHILDGESQGAGVGK